MILQFLMMVFKITILKNFNIACFNENQLAGNGLLLPSGPLRESLSALKNIDVIIINGEKNEVFEEKLLSFNKNLDIYYSSYKPINIQEFKGKRLLALAGIGNPENFFEFLKKNDLIIEKKFIFPDHYNFSINEIKIINIAENENYQIIMTEKITLKLNILIK